MTENSTGEGKRKFTPRLWPTIATICLLYLLLSLGFWQLDRAKQKSVLLEDFNKRQAETPLASLDPMVRQDRLHWRRAKLSGEFVRTPAFLLDNQVLKGRVGYYVYSIFELENKISILVNRGWVMGNPDRKLVPQVDYPAGAVVLAGVIKPPPATGLLLAENTEEELGRGLFRLQAINLEQINQKHGLSLLPYILRLEAASTAGFVREWREPGSGREKHLGYAFQWFAMTTALLVIFILVNIKKEANVDTAP